MLKRSPWSVTLLVAVPALAWAWSPPYAPEMPLPGSYFGYPGAYPQPYGMPVPPAWPAYPGGWMGPHSTSGLPQPSAGEPDRQTVAPSAQPGPEWGGYGRPLGAMPMIPRLDVARRMEGDDYLIDIRVENIEPDRIEIRPGRRGLVVSYDKSVKVDREDQLPAGAGYRRSYSISHGVITRRIGLPADAELDAMAREESDGHILLRIPRAASPRRGAW
ncbi:hypothetical protein [Thiorhodococcus minor]|uniref:Hsp20/alpha crystallin family protein n=1 Tax=Thiorhodococcus minor TaxID=57489 RepID=A0A6M0K2M7_9GAMM|nr:hypothetical protein [Thiorhodococcus minor]NEV64018.1 hypothetical protein [Thiorhodococcus minor]